MTARHERPSYLERAIIEAAQEWADEVHALRLTPDPATVIGRAARRLLDAVHDLDHLTVNLDGPTAQVLPFPIHEDGPASAGPSSRD